MIKIPRKEQFGYEREKYLGYYGYQRERLEHSEPIDYFDPEVEDEE